MKNRKILLVVIGIGIVVIIGILSGLFGTSDDSSKVTDKEYPSRGITGDPIDITLDFFEEWLLARQSTTSDPYTTKLSEREEVSFTLKDKLTASESIFRETGFDPVLCQIELPAKLRVKPVYENEGETQLLIMPKEKEGGVQSVVTLKSNEGLWEILDITCGSGEQGPPVGEFSFVQEGFLLQQSIMPPLDPNTWHLVFAQKGVLGYTAPLFFNESSKCIMDDGDELTCDEGMLMETMKVKIEGNMTEAGADVARLTLITD